MTDRDRKPNMDPHSLRVALRQIIGTTYACESFTSGIGACFRDGRTPTAEYLADRCCPSCIADRALWCEAA